MHFSGYTTYAQAQYRKLGHVHLILTQRFFADEELRFGVCSYLNKNATMQSMREEGREREWEREGERGKDGEGERGRRVDG